MLTDITYRKILLDSSPVGLEPPAGPRSHLLSKLVIRNILISWDSYLARNIQGVWRGEEIKDPLRIQQLPFVVESLPHLEERESGKVPDAMSLGGLLVVDPDQSDPVPGDLLTDPLEDAQDPLAGLAILGV